MFGKSYTEKKKKRHISWENRWFPVDFPLSKSVEPLAGLMISLGDFTNIYWESQKIIIKLIIHYIGYTILDMITILGITI